MKQRTSERVVRNVAKILLHAVEEMVEVLPDSKPGPRATGSLAHVVWLLQQSGRTVRDLHDLRHEGAHDAMAALAAIPIPDGVFGRFGYLITAFNEDWRRVLRRAIILMKPERRSLARS